VSTPAGVVSRRDDALQREALIAVLRQIRAGYPRRPDAFPWSLALVGLRDVRDGKLASGGAPESPHSSSPFNIKVESLTLRSFTREAVASCTPSTPATPGKRSRPRHSIAFRSHAGPAVARERTRLPAHRVVVPGAARTITTEDVETAREILILRQDTHLDSQSTLRCLPKSADMPPRSLSPTQQTG
jgi:hypothetical protein